MAAVAVTAFGSAAAALGLGLADPASAASLVYPAAWPPLWIFWMVWLIIYPASGVAVWLVWRERRRADVRGALVAFALLNVSAALFLPISALAGGVPAVLTLMDLNGLVTVVALAWLFSRYSAAAAWWLAPYLVWMPITTALKIWLWAVN